MAIAFDTFDRANNTTLGANWTSGSGGWSIASNVATPTALGNDCAAIWGALSTITDQFSEADVAVTGTVGGDQGIGLQVRGNGLSSQTFYRLVVDHASSNNVSLNRFNAGVQTQLGHWTVTWTDGDRWRLEVVGFVLVVKRNGVVVGTVDDSGSASKLSSGGPGVVYSSTESAATLNNWAGGELKLAFVSTNGSTPADNSQNPTATVSVAKDCAIVVAPNWVSASSSVSSVTDTLGNSYVQAPAAHHHELNDDQQDIWVCLASNGSNLANVVTVHYSDATGLFQRLIVSVYSPPANQVFLGIDDSNSSRTTTVNATVGALVINAAGVVFAVCNGDQGETYTAGSGFTLRTPAVASDTQSEDNLPSSGGTVTTSMTGSSTGGINMSACTFSVGGTPPPPPTLPPVLSQYGPGAPQMPAHAGWNP